VHPISSLARILSRWACSKTVCVGLVLTYIGGAQVLAQSAPTSLLDQAIERSAQNLNRRVTNGRSVHIDANLWQVAIVWTDGANNLTAQFCGGSIIAKSWVLTAGHCIDQSKPARAYEVLSGTDSLSHGGVRSRVLNYCVHRKYGTTPDGKRHFFDIALLEIDPHGPALIGTPIKGLPKVTPSLPAGILIRVTGWGATERSYQPTVLLQGVDVHYVDSATCNQKSSYDNNVTDYMLCAGEKGGGKDTCQGDSGGPASAEVNGTRRLVGISSWGEGCGEPNLYGVYTRVSEFSDWVRTNTRGAAAWQ
jgi:secreted trypsin-like serine protease